MGQIESYAKLESFAVRDSCPLYCHVHDASLAITQKVPKGCLFIVVKDPVTLDPVTYLPFDTNINNSFSWHAFLKLRQSDDISLSWRENRRSPLCMSKIRFNPKFGCIAGLLEAINVDSNEGGVWIQQSLSKAPTFHPLSEELDPPLKGFSSTREMILLLDPSQGDAQGEMVTRVIHVMAEQFLHLLITENKTLQNSCGGSVSDISPSQANNTPLENLGTLRKDEDRIISELIDTEAQYNAQQKNRGDGNRVDPPVTAATARSPCVRRATKSREGDMIDLLAVPYKSDYIDAMVLYVPNDELNDLEKQSLLGVVNGTIKDFERSFDSIDSVDAFSLREYNWSRLDSTKTQYLADWHKRYGNWCVPFWHLDMPELMTFIIAPIMEFDLHLHLDTSLLRYSEALRTSTVANFFKYAISSYNETAYYHNGFHGAQVLHASFLIFRGDYTIPSGDNSKVSTSQPISTLVSKTDILALLFGALCHDVDHPMLTNLFLRNANHRIAIRYNDSSILENYHASFTFRHILSRPESDIQELWPKHKRIAFRKAFINVILSTDMEFHGQGVMMARDRIRSHLRGEKPLSFATESDRFFIVESIIRMADASNPTLPFPALVMWGNAISEEFVLQTVVECEMGISSNHFMRLVARKNTARMLNDFCNLVVDPLYTEFGQIMPHVQRRREWLRGSIRVWSKVFDYYQAIQKYEDRISLCSSDEARLEVYLEDGRSIKHWLNVGPWRAEFGCWAIEGSIHCCRSSNCVNLDKRMNLLESSLWARQGIIWGNRLVLPPQVEDESGLRDIMHMNREEPQTAQVAFLPMAFLVPTVENLALRESSKDGIYPYLLSDNEDSVKSDLVAVDPPTRGSPKEESATNCTCGSSDGPLPDIIVDMSKLFNFPTLFRRMGHCGALPLTGRATDPKKWPSPVSFDTINFLKQPFPSRVCLNFVANKRSRLKENVVDNEQKENKKKSTKEAPGADEPRPQDEWTVLSEGAPC
eukprot:GHVH01007113.1.p1 GENE.GHVH01007113.1~~GHVH01007113.1.p1  ORF type:complete len:987 (+),score=137.61 GHVH01007113.1:1302-4262(+)